MLFLFAAEREDDRVHDECRHHQKVARMRAEGTRERRAELACEGERAARDDCRADELRFCLEPEKPPQHGDGECARIDGERKQERADDIGEHEGDEERHDAVQEDDGACLEERFACRPCGLRGASPPWVRAYAEQPADDDRAAEECGIGAGKHDAQEREREQRDERRRQYRICNRRDAGSLHFAEAHAIDGEEPDDECDRDEHAGGTCNGFFRALHVLRAEHAAEDIGAGSVCGAVSENQ